MSPLIVLIAVLSQAQQLGDGRDGVLEVTGPMTVNRATPLSADAAAGDPFVLVSDATPFSKGSLVLIVHTQWLSDGERYRVGEFSLHFVERVVGGRLEFSSALSRPWRAQEAQVVLVPQYTDVVVTASGVLEAPPWNGSSGGVVALAANGQVTIDGRISATGRGFRGGTARDLADREVGCMSEEESAPRGSERGEGALVGGFGTLFTGRRNNDSGGGGAICSYSGGGGGASLGEGGQGGFSADQRRDVGGRGGLGLSFAGLLLGGGGGASNGAFGQGAAGGRGGGAVFVRARSLTGSGVIEANGAPGAAPTGRFAGASGAGGAGSIVLEVVEDARCALRALGGTGGSSTFGHGPGGGGGGGTVSLRAGRIVECPSAVEGGGEGQVNGASVGAQPGLPGQASAREVAAQSPFEAGPGFTLMKLGCSASGVGPAWLWLVLVAGLRRWRLRV